MGSQKLVLQCEWKDNWNETKERFAKLWDHEELVIGRWFETTRAHDKTLVSLGFRGFFILSKKNRSISTTAFHMQVRILINYH